MARKKNAEVPEDDEPGLDISSLIDVTFLLLIYFLVTTTIQPREQDLKMALPAAAPSDSQPVLAPMLISVDRAGMVSVGAGSGREPLDADVENHDLPRLSERLSTYVTMAKAGGQEPVVQIFVDGEAIEQRVIDVLNALAGASVKSVTFTDVID
ncbi:ExbD/TolR family protein [Persicirhabdus sediminis]|uniref:Biopolymer transporter ExbD n=1 Tax=Persicirhabdus sediminis TaxID=454144 RepID=A0A8J7SL20_9BACT|nr:biopolymer transporter ExbD [Persicirhabdus sediminis]MBK1791140.1 biopolymer transporter ExbD [Persicirhabdus sediminis]